MSRRQSPLEQILIGFSEMPLWVSGIAAVLVFVTLEFVPTWFEGPSLTGKLYGQVAQGLAPWAAGLILMAGLAGVVKRLFQRYLASRVTGLKALRQLDWSGFEAYVGEVYRGQGYTVVERGGRLPDGGVDLELRRGSEKVLVQCKHWMNRQVPVQRVRELLGVVTAEGADRAIFVATGGFTRDAQRFAEGRSIELIEGKDLLALAKAPKTQSAYVSAHTETPACPRCGKGMVLRVAKRGPNPGSSFWGCSTYPECRATQAA